MTAEQEAARARAFAPTFWPGPDVLWALVLLAISHRKLATFATSVDTALYSTWGQLPRAGFDEQNLRSAQYLRRAHRFAISNVAGFLALGWAVGVSLRSKTSDPGIGVTTTIGVGILLWATLALGYSVRTRDEITLIEKVDTWAYRILYLLGSALLAFVAGLQVNGG